MADPVVHLTNGIPDSGTGNITTLGQTLLDGANVTTGAKADAAVTDPTASGSMVALLKGILSALGVTSGAAVITDANGTTQQYLRGLIKQWIAGTLVLGAGQNVIGNVGGKTTSVTVAPTVTATNAYGTNYVVGGLLTFANAFTSTGSGVIQSVRVSMKKVQTCGFTLLLFKSNPSNTTWTDAAVSAINAADITKLIAAIPLTANSQAGTCTVLEADGLGIAKNIGATSLYGVLLCNAALTNQFAATSDVTDVEVTTMLDA